MKTRLASFVAVFAGSLLASLAQAQVASTVPPVDPCNITPPTRRSCLECARNERDWCRNRRGITPEELEECLANTRDGYRLCVERVLTPAPTTPTAPITMIGSDLNGDGAISSLDLFEGIDWLMNDLIDQREFFDFVNDFFSRT